MPAIEASKKPLDRQGLRRTRKGDFSAGGKYRRRGPRNRFSTQASRDSEVDRIIAHMTSGMKAADIAEAMK